MKPTTSLPSTVDRRVVSTGMVLSDCAGCQDASPGGDGQKHWGYTGSLNRLQLLIAWSSHKWTGTSSGTSVIWTWSNRTESGSRYTPALDCSLLTFWRWNVAYMYLLFENIIYSPDASSNVNLFVAYVKCGLYEINKNSLEQMLHIDRSGQDLDLYKH